MWNQMDFLCKGPLSNNGCCLPLILVKHCFAIIRNSTNVIPTVEGKLTFSKDPSNLRFLFKTKQRSHQKITMSRYSPNDTQSLK